MYNETEGLFDIATRHEYTAINPLVMRMIIIYTLDSLVN